MTCRRQSNRGWWGYRSSSWSGQWRNQGSHWSMPLRSVIVTYFASCQIICTSTRHWSSCIISDHLCVNSVINCLASCQSICTNKHHNLQDVLEQIRSWHFLFFSFFVHILVIERSYLMNDSNKQCFLWKWMTSCYHFWLHSVLNLLCVTHTCPSFRMFVLVDLVSITEMKSLNQSEFWQNENTVVADQK